MVASEFLTKKLGVLLMIFAASFVASAQAFHVVDEEGQRMAKFECMVNTSDQGCSGWKAGEGGVVDVFTFPGAKVIDVLVRADGYASAIKRFSGEELAAFSSPETEMTLKRGEPVELRLETAEGVELPDDLRPDVYFAEIEWRASMMRQPMNRTRYAKDAPELDFNMLVKPTGKGKFELRLAKDTPPFYVAIHQDGFLRFFEAGPFTMADVRDGARAIHVPKAAKLDVKLDMSAAKEGDLPKGARFDVLYKRPGNSGGYLFAAQEKRESVKDASLSIADLVPGEYRYTVITDVEQMSQPIRRGDVHPGPFRDVGVVKIGDGETKVVDVKYVPLDMDVTKGNRTAIVHILKPNKEPAAGKKAIIYYVDEHYGDSRCSTAKCRLTEPSHWKTSPWVKRLHWEFLVTA